MTREEAIESLRECAETLRHIAKLTESLVSGVEMKHRKATEALKRPQEPQMTRAEAIEKAASELAHFVTESEYTDYCTLDDGRICSVDFYHKPPKTTCVLRINERRVAVGRSWCARGDKLNLYIGELIALYCALGREVPVWLLHIPQE